MSWRLARSLAQLATEIRQLHGPTTIWAIGDKAHAGRPSDHNPNADDVVCAIDIVGETQAQAATDNIAQRRDNRLAYQIWKRRIMSGNGGPSPWVWRPYNGANPHTTHAHVSVGRGPDGAKVRPDLYDDVTPWLEEKDEGMATLSKEAQAFYQRQYELLQEIDARPTTLPALVRYYRVVRGHFPNK